MVKDHSESDSKKKHAVAISRWLSHFTIGAGNWYGFKCAFSNSSQPTHLRQFSNLHPTI